jgi:lipopolysaccharide transport system ATP-binding protein
MNKEKVLHLTNISKSFKIQHDVSGEGQPKQPTLSDYFKKKFFKKKIQMDIFWALKNINMEVYKGESVALIGKNGSGKSTLLKLISKIMYPDDGKIFSKGKISSLLEVGTGFHPELSGAENIYLNGAILGMKKEDVKKYYDEIIEFSGIREFIDVPVKRYSSGMYLRLAFAIAVHLTSDILLLDEVFAVGDNSFQKKCKNKIMSFLNSGKTIIFVSHNMQSVKEFCSSAYLIHKGKISHKYTNVNEAIKNYEQNSWLS